MTAPEQWAWLARIRRTQGRKGEVFAEILTDFPEKFSERKRLWLIGTARPTRTSRPAGNSLSSGSSAALPREVELIAHWLHKGGIVLHFAGVDSISAAEELIGLGVAIPRAERAPLGENEAYIDDLVGCALIDVAGPAPIIIGEIEDVDKTAGPTPLLVVRASASRDNEILIPFAKSYLRRLDLEGKHVEMALPEGLLDLNEGN
jgi:16S rRNA processing protein RimM